MPYDIFSLRPAIIMMGSKDNSGYIHCRISRNTQGWPWFAVNANSAMGGRVERRNAEKISKFQFPRPSQFNFGQKKLGEFMF